jgi:hypothetical protein
MGMVREPQFHHLLKEVKLRRKRGAHSAFDISFQANQAWPAKAGVVLVRVAWTELETRQTTSKSNTFCPSLLYIWGPGTRKAPS